MYWMDILVRIKRLVLDDYFRFTQKALDEMEFDGLQPGNVKEAILNAQTIDKVIRSRSTKKRFSGEKLYVIKSFDYSGTLIYTKGAIAKEEDQEVFYVLISAKIATYD